MAGKTWITELSLLALFVLPLLPEIGIDMSAEANVRIMAISSILTRIAMKEGWFEK